MNEMNSTVKVRDWREGEVTATYEATPDGIKALENALLSKLVHDHRGDDEVILISVRIEVQLLKGKPLEKFPPDDIVERARQAKGKSMDDTVAELAKTVDGLGVPSAGESVRDDEQLKDK